MRNLFSRLVLGSSWLFAAAWLTACGGGGDAVAEGAASADALQTAQSLESAQALSSEGGTAAQSDDDVASFEPQPWELEYDDATAQAFIASLPPASSEWRAPGTRVKWNPGHYVALSRRDDASLHTALREIQHLPQVKGLLLRYGWRQLEPRKGDYRFETIDRDLALARSYGKRLFIMVETKAFRSGVRAVPDYMHTAEYSGGAYKIRIDAKPTLGSSNNYGENAALHNDKVRDRLIALTTALGRRYNLNNSVEGVSFNETAMGQMVKPLSNAQTAAFFRNLAQVDTATRRAFPNTVVMQFINFPVSYMPGLVRNMVSSSVALGGPDTFLNDHDLNRFTYPLYDYAQGKVPIGPSVQPENYFARSHNGPHAPPKVSELHAFAQNRLHANYLFWTRTLIPPLKPYNNVLRMFKSEAFPSDGAGGLRSGCPATFGLCVRSL
jgi:hypothetical protein